MTDPYSEETAARMDADIRAFVLMFDKVLADILRDVQASHRLGLGAAIDLMLAEIYHTRGTLSAAVHSQIKGTL